MRPCTIQAVLASILPICVSASALADVIDFEDVATQPTSELVDYGEVLDGYRGFDWASNGAYGDAALVYMNNATVASGYQSAIPAGTRALFSRTSNSSTHELTIARSTTWNFEQVDIAAAWREGLFVEFVGLLGGNTLYSFSTTLSTAGVMNSMSLNFVGIDTLLIRSSGGTDVYSGYSGQHLIVDNFTYSVPAPGALALFALAVGARRRRR